LIDTVKFPYITYMDSKYLLDDIFNEEKNKVFGETEKTIIFIHTANLFIIDGTITAEAVYIKQAEEGYGTERSEPYYLDELRKAAATDKDFIIMEYDPFICDVIENLITGVPKQYNLCRWCLLIFFHADTCPPGEENHPMYNLNDEKLEILWPLFYSQFFYLYTMPVGHTLTLMELKKLKNGNVGPDTTVEEFEEYLRNTKLGIFPKPVFPFYDIDDKKMIEFIDRRLMNAIRRKHLGID